MVSQIVLTNFFSIKDQAVVDLRVANSRLFKNTETQNNTFADAGATLLKSIAIFGPNASGKSNILNAIKVCVMYIRDSHSYSELTPPQFEPFKFYDEQLPSSFEIDLSIDGERYEYGFCLLNKRIVEEHLYSYPKKYKSLVFKREVKNDGMTTFSFAKRLSRPKDIEANTSPYTLMLTRAALMNRPEALKVFNFVTNNITIGLPNFEDVELEQLLQNHKDTIISALRHADSDIVDFEFITNPGLAKRLVTYHKGNPNKPFDFQKEESAGTRRLLMLLTAFIDVAENGKLLIIDELEASLHPHLSQYAVKIFNRSQGSQVIFSTHDVNLLNIDILRPDQIYFVSKDYTNGSSELYSLADFTEYKNYKNLRRDYEQGRFGATPILPTL